jgi:hypothetical protein
MATDNYRTGDARETERGDLLELLALLADPTKRRLLAYIAYDNPEDVEDIPTHTGASKHLDEESVARLLDSLRDDHLPTLEGTGIIDWDRERDVVTRGERFDDLWPVLRLMIAHREELPEEWLSFAEFEDFDGFDDDFRWGNDPRP